MMRFSACAGLLAPLDSHGQNSSGDLEAGLGSFFEPLQPSEPPRKKRRIAEDDTPLMQTAPAAWAILLDVTLDLIPSQIHRAFPQSAPATADRPVQVVLSRGRDPAQRHKNHHGKASSQREEFRLDLSRHDAEVPPLSISLDTRHSEDLVEVLDDVLRLSQRATPKIDARKATDIAFADCLLVPPSDQSPTFSLRCQIKWRLGLQGFVFKSKSSDWLHAIAHMYLPGTLPLDSVSWSPHDFYENVFCPERTQHVPAGLQPAGLSSQLYPFQKRAVKWLMQREGVQVDEHGRIAAYSTDTLRSSLFSKHKDAHGQAYQVSQILEEVRSADASHLDMRLKGGILAEEMGLGKTVELIALLLIHRRPEGSPKKELDPYTATTVRTSNATLVITPPHILGQWQSELAHHSPGLKVYHYKGLQKIKSSVEDIRKLLLEQDVVLTTYSVLAREVHYATPPPDRNLRHEKQHKARRSPLMELYWWRVCLDEAQMIESGVSNAATVARLIPRVNAWAVSGTPLKKDIKDLLGLLIFLRYEPFCNAEVWKRLTQGYNSILADLIQTIALRHPKSRLRDELSLPPQKRVTITCSFTAIEAQRYQDLFRQMCVEVGVDESGGPISEDWNPDHPATIIAMRDWLNRLRTTCLHAEIGGRNRRALGTKSGPLRTVDEVLEVMIDQNETALRVQERTVLNHMIKRGQILSFGHRPQAALNLFNEALTIATAAVEESRAGLADEKKRVEAARDDLPIDHHDDIEEDDEDDDSHDKRGHLGQCRQRLRSALEVQHVCYFFTATAYFQVKDNKDLTEIDSDAWKALDKLESECYDHAKEVRKELLSTVITKTNHMMEKVALAKEKSLFAFSTIKQVENFRGLESRKISDKVEMLRRLMNEYAEQLTEWRSTLVKLLQASLLDQEDVELTGEEYEETTKQQDEQYALLEALRAGLADRHCAVTGQLNLLVNHEMKQALKLAVDGKRDDVNDKGPAPDLFKSILMARQRLNPPENLQVATSTSTPKPSLSFRGIMTEIRLMITSVQWQGSERGQAEVAILERELRSLQSISNAQMRDVERFEKELDLFRSTMNQRLEFYKQLQQISDMVAPLQEEASDDVNHEQLAETQRFENTANERLSTLKTKKRFLCHLQAQSQKKDDQRYCVICQDQFEVGVLTICGHQYCKDCIRTWYQHHRSCPTCKKQLRLSDFHQITYKPQELRAHQESSSASSEADGSPLAASIASPSKSSIYADVSEQTLNEIKGIDLPGESYGVKIDMISRQLLWLRRSDPGSKSIIFSQYRDFLEVLGSAFSSHRIGYTQISDKSGIERFREDASVECFMLHAKADSSGLNLVNATHVFLCEPLINAAIELQAIARVHRIGQRRATTVWMYLVSDTVEEAIYEISVERRLAHMRRSAKTSQEASRAVTPTPGVIEEDKLDKANSMVLQSAPISNLLTTGQSGGELVGKGDLWNCLFSKARKNEVLSLHGITEAGPAGRQVGAFLRAEAAEDRRSGASI